MQGTVALPGDITQGGTVGGARTTGMAEVALVAIHEFEVVAEHADQVFLQSHHQRVHPVVEDHVCPFPAHLGAHPGGHVLHVHRCADHGAGNPQTLGAVALHLGSQHQFRCRFGHGGFHF